MHKITEHGRKFWTGDPQLESFSRMGIPPPYCSGERLLVRLGTYSSCIPFCTAQLMDECVKRKRSRDPCTLVYPPQSAEEDAVLAQAYSWGGKEGRRE